MSLPAPKLADFHSLHESCGSIVDIKPAREAGDDGHHALFGWCPACGATSRETVNLAELDGWLDSMSAPEASESTFAQALLKAREFLQRQSHT